MIYSQFNANLQKSMQSLFNSDEQIATGKKINRPSDDPVAISSIISGEAQLSSFAGYQEAIGNSTLLLNGTSSALDNLGSLITSAKQIATNAASSPSTSDLAHYASMVGNLLQSVTGVANTQVGDRYIFSGYKTDQPAVNTTTGMYQGTADRISMEINTGVRIDVNMAADELIAYGPASAASPDSGLITAAGGFTSPANVYSTNGGSLNISLGGGPVTAVAIAAGATLTGVRDAINNANTGVRAEVINANVNGSPADDRIMLSAAPASGAVAISVAVTTADAAGTGLNQIASGAMASVVSPDLTIIGALSILKTALEQGDQPAIQRSLAALNSLATTVVEKQSEVGQRLQWIDSEKKYLTAKDADVTNAVADKLTLSEVDIARLITDAQQKQASLSSLRTISSGFLNTSLFDFLK